LRTAESFGEFSELIDAKRGSKDPAWITRSRISVVSPAMLPKPHATCSRMSSLGEDRSSTKMGTVPDSTTTRVWPESPDATFVNAHADSN
jgi:hypothetical protein